MSIVILIIGFGFLIKGADFLVSGASSLAKRIGVSDLVIGLTVVAFGTSTPELLVNIFASAQGSTDIAIANILGSNIFNILLILGLSSLIYPLAVTGGTVWKEIPFSLLAALMLGVLANDLLFDKLGYSMLTRIDGFIFIAFFVIFIYYIISIAKNFENGGNNKEGKKSLLKLLFMIGSGFAGLIFGGKIVVDSAVNIASQLGISQSLIGLTIVSIGTSLPELAASAVAAYRKSPDIAVGNIIGSNIFNIFFVLGISALIRPLPITTQINADIIILIGTSLLLFFFMFTGKRRMLDRWEGAVFILLYMWYIIFIIKRG